MGIQYDAFIRTTDAKHEGVVRAILDRVWEKGDIYKAKYEGARLLSLYFLQQDLLWECSTPICTGLLETRHAKEI